MQAGGAPRKILISAGEASGDLYAALLVEELRRRWPETEFLGCVGPRLRRAGVRDVIRAESLAVVGLLEVVRHIPRIYRQYRKLLAAARQEKPELAILTDSPDFHLRVARRLHRWGVPVIYLVAPQVWAWRKGRLPLMRRVLTRLLCIFPFEEKFFREHGVPVTYIGHPLAGLVRPSMAKPDFFRKHGLPDERPLIAVLPGSRRGEAARHLPELLGAIELIRKERPATFVLPASSNTGTAFFRERIGESGIQVIEGEAWDAIAHADLALAASGTVTVEAALLGTPMIAFYRVNPLSWLIGKMLVRVPFFSMVNLIAERKIVPELMQSDMTARRIGDEANSLLGDQDRRLRMKRDLAEVAAKLSDRGDAIARAADAIVAMREDRVVQLQAN
ncbi:MAG: lipid-A-disaccharide synthase [Bryobacteraceae bacterium]